MAYTATSNDEFAAFAKRAEEEAEASKKALSGGNNFHQDYENPEYVALSNTPKIIRIVGRAPVSMKPGSHVDGTDAHEIFYSEVLDDNNKKMQLKLPLHSEDPNHEHIMWRIIRDVKQTVPRRDAEGKIVYDKDGRVEKDYVNQHKPYFNKVNKGGLEPTDSQYTFAKGWAGQQIVLLNVIDREDNWCKEHKHTKILSKNCNISKKDGTTKFYDKGVPSYGFLAKISSIVSKYGTWEGYDLQIRRTGNKQDPYEVKNASSYKTRGVFEELDESKLDFISVASGLTNEELEYERYDFSKIFAPTSYQKILSRLGNTIKAIDADLNKNYYNELQALAEKEKADYEAANPPQNEPAVQPAPTFVAESDTFVEPTTVVETPVVNAAPVVESAPVVETAPVQESVAPRTVNRAAAPVASSGLTPDKIALLQGWGNLTDEEKDAIVDVETFPDGALKNIVFKPGNTLVSCPETFLDGSHGCKKDSPDWFVHCPSCGKKF